MKAPSPKPSPWSLDRVFNFGKHKGSTLRDVIQDDVEYVSWCMAEIENFELDNEACKKYNAQPKPRHYLEDMDDSEFNDYHEFGNNF